MKTPELKQNAGGVFYIHWTDKGRSKRVSTRQKDQRSAQIFLANWLIVGNTESAPETAASTFHVRDLWDAYCKGHKVVSAATRESSWKNLEPFFGDLTISQVTYEKVEGVGEGKARVPGYFEMRADGRIGRPSVGSTVRRELNALKACFHWCADKRRKLIAKADIPEFDVPPDGDPKDRWLRHEEIQKLFDAAGQIRLFFINKSARLSRGERFLWLALETAARKTAIYELTWDRVDFDIGVIFYDVPGRVKTKKRRSSVPISKALMPILLRAHKERVSNYVLDNKADVGKMLKNIADRAGVPDVSPHVLRHTAATHMARRGVPLWKIAKILGNTLAMVERVYAKHCPDDLRESVDMISGGVLEPAE